MLLQVLVAASAAVGLWLLGIVLNAVLTLTSWRARGEPPEITWRESAPWDLRTAAVEGVARKLGAEGFRGVGWRREGRALGGVTSAMFWSEADRTAASVWRFAALWPFAVRVHASFLSRAADGILVHTGATELDIPGVDSAASEGFEERLLSHRRRLAAHGGPAPGGSDRAWIDEVDGRLFALIREHGLPLGS